MLWKINPKEKKYIYTSNSFTGTIFHYRFTCIYNFLTFRATVQTVLGTVYKMTTGDAPFSVIPSVKYNGTHLYTWVGVTVMTPPRLHYLGSPVFLSTYSQSLY